MDFHRFTFTHHATQDHSFYVHAIEDMDGGQPEQISAAFKRLDSEAVEKYNKSPQKGKKPRLPGVADQDVDDELKLGDVPPEDRSRRIWAVLRNVEGAGGGISELAIADLPAAERIMDVIRSKKIENYTYLVSKRLIRGSRPSPQKLADLFHHNGVKSTINLCREMHHGDDEIVDQAGLTGRVRTLHIPLVDNGVPSPTQILQFFNYLSDPDNIPAYVHCEQGIGRTGVMVGCYRMAFNGWTAAVAESEAKRFDNGMPMQLTFIVNFPSVLEGNDVNRWTPFAEMTFPLEQADSPTSPPDPEIIRAMCLDPRMPKPKPAMGG